MKIVVVVPTYNEAGNLSALADALLALPLKEAAENVVPVAVTAAESVQRLRTWASGRCLDAGRPGIYRNRDVVSPSVRHVARASAN